mgnify:CR=1 FL=1
MTHPEFSIAQTLLLVCSLSMDAFFAGFTYGSGRIKIPFRSVFIISIICSATLFLSLFTGTLISDYLSDSTARIIGFTILFILGIIKLFDGLLKIYINKKCELHKEITFSLFNLRFILNVYADPCKADKIADKILSPAEAAALALALSLDGLAAGFSAALTNANALFTSGLSLAFHLLAIPLGFFIGEKIAQKTKRDFSWLSGIMLIILALLRLK